MMKPCLRCRVVFSLLAILVSVPAAFCAQQFVHSTTAPITLLDPAAGVAQADPYPSSLPVFGVSGKVITKLTVTLNGFNHTFPGDVSVLLVGPTGASVVLMSHLGNGQDASGASLTFDDAAPAGIPAGGPVVSGVYRPATNGAMAVFPAPAPVATGTSLAIFNGTDANGVWNLYVIDDSSTDAGSISGGWTLNLTVADQSFSGPGVIINDSTNTPTKATSYPSTAVVSGLSGTITKLTLNLQGFTHSYPDDVDILLVGPTGTNVIVMSDVGGTQPGATNVNLVLDDSAPTPLSAVGPLVDGIFQPNNAGNGDVFPAPAPVPTGGSALSAFNGTSPNGTWLLYVVDDTSADGGSISNWSLNIQTTTGATAPTQPGSVIISEFRVRGPNGANDEFIELYNAGDANHFVTPIDGSAGYAVAASDGVIRFVVPTGTVIPAHGHYLGVNSAGYSLSGYPAGPGLTATGDATYTTDIADNAGIALFRTANVSNFTLANRLDAVGSTSETNTLYKEGSGYPALTPFSIDYSFYRNLTNGTAFNGYPKDSDDNAADFVFVDSNGTTAGAGQRLGAASPENLSSPIHLAIGAPLIRTLTDSTLAVSNAPNHVRDFTSVPALASTFGTLNLRRHFVNRTGRDLTKLRFQIGDVSTFPAPQGAADLRPRSAGDAVVVVGGNNVIVRGATLDQPPSQPNGGGFNSTFSVTNITSASPLANGASIDVQFLFGIQQIGNYHMMVIPETVPASASDVWTISGSTEGGDGEVVAAPVMSPLYFARVRDTKLPFATRAGHFYQLQFEPSLTNGSWTNIDVPYAGTGYPLEATHTSGKGLPAEFYRLQVVP